MSGLLKDDLTVALDEVDRTASRIVTIYEDLIALAADPELSRHLRERAERHRVALVAFNKARQAAGETPEVADPERAHLQSLWVVLKSAVAGGESRQRLDESLEALRDELCRAIRAARELRPGPPVLAALEGLEHGLD